jgi:NAD(P)-dependent dehydrogenase (short-subunit alcohol dehydrogenase family)
MKFDSSRLYSIVEFGNSVYTDYNTLDNANYPTTPLFGHEDESFHVLGEANLDNQLDLVGGWCVDSNSIEQCVQQIISTFGKLDITIANAGFGVEGKIEALTDSDWNRQLAGNVTGLALTCKFAMPHLRNTKGQIVLLGSVGAFLPNPNVGAYGASKAAVHSIGETLQVELLGTGVSCTTIHPGFVESNITRIDNQGLFHPEAKDPRPANLLWKTDKAARVMIRAIANRKKVFVFTGHGKIAVFLAKFFPSIARKIIAKGA